MSISSGVEPAVRDRIAGAYAVVILPALNEERGLARTLSQLPLDQFDFPGRRVVVLVVDGGSTDRTREVAQAAGAPVVTQTTRGKGAAIVEAIEWVRSLGAKYAVVLDADATYPPDRIVPTLDLLRGGTDLVIGVRRPVWGAPRNRVELVHRFGNVLFSYCASLLARRTILDLCSGFWGVSTERFAELELGEHQFAIEGELVLKSIRRGFRVQQIPVEYRDRLGEAKLRALRDGGHILLTILQYARPGRAPDPDEAPSQSWGRAVLAICLAAGSSRALLTYAPSEAAEAQRVARYLATHPTSHEGRRREQAEVCGDPGPGRRIGPTRNLLAGRFASDGGHEVRPDPIGDHFDPLPPAQPDGRTSLERGGRADRGGDGALEPRGGTGRRILAARPFGILSPVDHVSLELRPPDPAEDPPAGQRVQRRRPTRFSRRLGQ